MVLTMMCEEIYEMKGNEEVYEKKGDEKEINDVKGQALRKRSTRIPKSKCLMRRWLKRHCEPESDESQRSRP